MAVRFTFNGEVAQKIRKKGKREKPAGLHTRGTWDREGGTRRAPTTRITGKDERFL